MKEDVLLLPPMMEAEMCIPIDRAADEACEQLGLPLLGGPSGRGWSYFSTAQTCPYLFKETYERTDGDERERTKPAEELQIGGLYHLLQAFFYAYGLGGGPALYYNRGLIAPEFASRLKHPELIQPVALPPDAADRLLAYLKRWADTAMLGDWERTRKLLVAQIQNGDPAAFTFAPTAVLDAATLSVVPEERPSLSIIFAAERLFDAHTSYYGGGQEDVEPLAIEWFARHPLLGYTCRYDAIMRLGPNDPFVRDGYLEPGAILIHERKSAKWLSEWATEGWFLDGEILGQLLLWEPSGCAELFGPLAGLVVDVATKEKTSHFARILVPKNPVTVRAHEQGVKYQLAEIALWRATGLYPKRWISCWRYGRKCGLYELCRADTAIEATMQAEEENYG